jgi:glycine cleavage system H protein
MQNPRDIKFTKEHEWVRIEGDEAVFGISDHAQSALGDVTYVELPSVGKEVKQFSVYASIESVKAASDIYAPLSGRIVAVNEALDDTPELVNSSPYGDGWICRIAIDEAAEAGKLMDADAYEKYLEESEQ